MVRIKPAFDGSDDSQFPDEGPAFYDGPPPPTAIYEGVIKRMGLAKISSGDNAGQDRISLLLEIKKGPYKGAGIWHSINLTKQSRWAVNQFLEALTDGSEKQKNTLVKLFWQSGYDVEPEPTGRMGQQFITIGSKFRPIGRTVSFMTKMDSYNDEPKAAIQRFIVPQEEEEEITMDTPLEGLSEFAPPEEVSVGVNDSDDPWT